MVSHKDLTTQSYIVNITDKNNEALTKTIRVLPFNFNWNY
ncbi:hypothetical protein DK880_00171 [Candidatus Cardinium hertigii]|uniref:Uncharacterized protein n=1 Tax=Candidatus Cardinium hertigii TaxID=247481 RepID=A0A2Z3LG12_9BACT|nr:hypothetical protein DK880_00171 [Candidatus Cardinium hertigii]